MFKNIIFVCLLLIGKNGLSEGGCANNKYNQNQNGDVSTCTIWGRYNVKTFDDHGISFGNKCTFTMVSLTFELSEFRIDVGLHPGCRDKPLCHTVTTILYNGETYKLDLENGQGPVLTSARGDTYSIPTTEVDGLRVHQPAATVIAEFTNIGITVNWNEQNLVQITINNNQGHRLKGLCGNNDKCSSNDLMLVNGAVASLLKVITEWQTDRRTCIDSINTASPCQTKFQTDQATTACSVLKHVRFQEAQKVLNPDIYIGACVTDYCSCNPQANKKTEDCLCDSFDAYAKASINAGGNRVAWRGSDLCPFTCPAGLRYFPCAPKGGLQTCTDPTAVEVAGKCEEGCYCSPNTFFHDGKCYLKKNCPCVHGGRTIQPGATVKQNCHTCTCINGKIECPKIPPCRVTATVYGDPHYVTWDGKRYDFMGKCDYYLVKGEDFSIEADHQVYRGGKFIKDRYAGGVSWTRGVTIRMQGQVVTLKPDLVVVVNNVTVNRFPYQIEGIVITKPHGRHILVDLPNWVQVQWDGYSTATLGLPTDLEGQVEGLMGTYTGDTSDDFLTPLGDIVDDPVTFGNSWKTEFACQDEPLQAAKHPCDINPGTKPTAQRICGLIKSNTFKQCGNDVDSLYENCVYDTCYCKDDPAKCACDVIAVVAEGCGAQGIVTNWRDQQPECRLPCPADMIYQECGDACSGSCEDISIRPACTKTCIEGCSCAPGLTLDENGKCVPIAQCKCRIDGVVFPPGFQYLKSEHELLTCTNGRWVTSEPDDKEHGKIPNQNQLNEKCNADINSVYTACRYPDPKSCQNMHIFEITSIAVCEEGCECKEGFVFDATRKVCVRPEECPCYERGQSFEQGGVMIQEGCHRCVCSNRQWQCKQEECDKLCIENEIKKEGCNTCRCKDAFWECTKHDCTQQCPVEGQSKKVDCNTCMCTGGFWACTMMECHHECSPQDVRIEGCKTCNCANGKWVCNEDGCVPASCPAEGQVKVFKSGKCVCKGGSWKCVKGQCDLWGDSHVRTFDGARFDFQGECSYTLVDGKIGDDRFSITFSNGRCSHAGATCLKSFTIDSTIRGVQQTVTLTRKGKIPSQEDLKNIVLTDHFLYVTLKIADAGIEVFWDKNTWIYVKVDTPWQNKVMGLCGNYNLAAQDDVPEYNANDPKNELMTYIHAWRTISECPDTEPNTNTCDQVRRPWAEAQCAILRSTTFAPCHDKVPVDSYYQACVTDTCKCDLGGDCECLCSAISMYAQQCNNYGVSIQWRSQDICPIQCTKNTVYQPCTTTCPRKTCETIRKNIDLDCDEEICVEGCTPKPLPPGMVYTDTNFEKDVDETSCTENLCENMFYEGEVMHKDKCNVCVCMSGQERCVKLPCPDDVVKEPTTIGGREVTPNPNPDGTPDVTPNPGRELTTAAIKTTPYPQEPPATIANTAVQWPSTTTAKPERICDKTKCPVLNCPDRITEEVQLQSECCKSCQHETKCFVTMETTKRVMLKKPGQLWMDGPCKECVCVGDENFNHCTECKKKVCATVKVQNTTIGGTYYEFTNGPCCPTMEPRACFYQNKVYRVGELWDVNECTSFKCIKDPATNLIYIQELRGMCHETCPIGFVYKKSQNQCCGECVQESCILGDVTRKAGEAWTSDDGCTSYVCTSAKGAYHVLSRKTVCPPVQKCPGQIHKVGCCEYCDTFELFDWQKVPSTCNAEALHDEAVPPAV